MDFELRRMWARLEEGEEWLIRGGSNMADPRYTSLGHRLGQAIMLTFEEEMGRVQRVRCALDDAGPRAERMVAERLAGIEFSTVRSILIEAVTDVAFYLGGSVALGTVGGAAAGAIFGGVGALPGAYVGGSIGAEVGGLILGFLGLKCLAEGLIDTIPEAVRCYCDGVMQAWGATHWDHRDGCRAGLDGDIQFAAAKIAHGHVLLLTALLMAMVAYLTRGKGNRSLLLKQIRESKRLGPKIAEWLEKNERKLVDHPNLKARERPRAASEEVLSQAMTPSQMKKAIAERGGPTKAAQSAERSTSGVGSSGKVAISVTTLNGATRTVPLGFQSETQFFRAADELQTALRSSGIDDAVVGVRGSSVSGASYRTGAPFGPKSDIDFFVESAKLTEGYKTSPNIPGFVNPKPILRDYPELKSWSDQWAAELGRKVTPGGFAPGTIPNHPAIVMR